MADRNARCRALKTVGRLTEMVEARYGLSIDFNGSLPHLSDVCRLYDETRAMLLARHGEAAALATPEYAKAVLISEAIRMFLREIAPRRSKKNRK